MNLIIFDPLLPALPADSHYSHYLFRNQLLLDDLLFKMLMNS